MTNEEASWLSETLDDMPYNGGRSESMGGADVSYRLVALVDDEAVFDSIYQDSAAMIEDIYKAERAVEKKLEAEADGQECD